MRGAFTGATDHKPGLFELADGGTLFLDEIGELPLSVQAKLLRVLELGEVHRVGSLEPRRVNVHVDRRDQPRPARGSRRRPLPQRPLLPPQHRRGEAAAAARSARGHSVSDRRVRARDVASACRSRWLGLTPGAERLLGGAAWDGNVRELRNVIERACILADGDFITERELAVSMPDARRTPPARAGAALRGPRGRRGRGQDLLVTVEREHIQRALVRAARQQEGGGADARA